ncbi:MAG: DUF4397 domain-containing protein [Bacteroidetes bacterium]|nr:DUF4397 domain-containing protein [Bacteroidota bacterium]
MRNSKKQFFWGVALVGILSAGWAGCAKTGTTFTTSPVTYVSVLNQAPYGPTIDIYFNDTLATGSAGVASGSFSSKYSPIKPGNYDVKFKQNGTSTLIDEIPTSPYDTLSIYTFLLYNNPDKTVKAFKIKDDFSTISQTYANIRFFNLSPDAPSVDLFINDAAVQGATARNPADNVINTSFNAFQSLAPGSFNVKVKVAGKDSVLASQGTLTLIGGYVYTIFLSGPSTKLSLNVLQASY